VTSIMFYSPETCGGGGGDFEMMGWWRVEPARVSWSTPTISKT
jgi:hypothetical protein